MERVLRSRRVNETVCSLCEGAGWYMSGDYDNLKTTCSKCGGKGRWYDYIIEEVGVFEGTCSACSGRGQTISGECYSCRGTGNGLVRTYERDTSGGCFITTAACEVLRLPDDCTELQEMRALRDRLFRSNPAASMLYSNYEAASSFIVPKLLAHPKREEIATEVIAVARQAIDLAADDQLDTAIELYIRMTFRLATELGSGSSGLG